jgi:hypothetical protein
MADEQLQHQRKTLSRVTESQKKERHNQQKLESAQRSRPPRKTELLSGLTDSQKKERLNRQKLASRHRRKGTQAKLPRKYENLSTVTKSL